MVINRIPRLLIKFPKGADFTQTVSDGALPGKSGMRAAGGLHKKNTTPARARREESPPSGNVSYLERLAGIESLAIMGEQLVNREQIG
jgi:hypothetical protein